VVTLHQNYSFLFIKTLHFYTFEIRIDCRQQSTLARHLIRCPYKRGFIPLHKRVETRSGNRKWRDMDK